MMTENPTPNEEMQVEALTPTQLKQHEWTEMTFVPVAVIAQTDPQQDPAVFPTEEPKVGVACVVCYVPLTALSMDTPCEGKSILAD